MKNVLSSFIILVSVFLGAQAARVDFGGTWNLDLNTSHVTASNVVSTSGTNAAVAFDLANTSSLSTQAGGVYNTFGVITLGPTEGDSISLQFTIAFTTNTGTAVNLDRRLVFGLAGSDDKVFAMVDTGTADGTKLNFGEAINNAGTVSAGALYRSANTTFSQTGVVNFSLGADASADTTYTMTLTRTAGGAELNLFQAKTGNDWTATTRTYTTEQANDLSFDKVFIGLNATQGDFAYTVTDLSVRDVVTKMRNIRLVLLSSMGLSLR